MLQNHLEHVKKLHPRAPVVRLVIFLFLILLKPNYFFKNYTMANKFHGIMILGWLKGRMRQLDKPQEGDKCIHKLRYHPS